MIQAGAIEILPLGTDDGARYERYASLRKLPGESHEAGEEGKMSEGVLHQNLSFSSKALKSCASVIVALSRVGSLE
jgi:hypothetical protein